MINLSVDLLFLLYIFIMGFFLGLIIPSIYKKFSLRIPSLKQLKQFKNKFFPKKLCHCGLTKTPPYCDRSHPFTWRCFRWWRWINDNLDDRDKGL